MNIFSLEVYTALIKAGWQQGRKIDTRVYMRILKEEGYTWLPQAQEFLTKFGGLSVEFNSGNGLFSDFVFDVEKCVNDFDSGWLLEDYAERIGTNKLCPLGEAYSSHMILFVDNNSRFYGGYDDFLVLLGENEVQFIENICRKKTLKSNLL